MAKAINAFERHKTVEEISKTRDMADIFRRFVCRPSHGKRNHRGLCLRCDALLRRRLNPASIQAQNSKRRARELTGGSYTATEWQTLKRQLGNRCVGCWLTEVELKALGRKIAPDHIVPLSKGGLNIIENLQPLCHGRGGCNNSKGNKYKDFLIA